MVCSPAQWAASSERLAAAGQDEGSQELGRWWLSPWRNMILLHGWWRWWLVGKQVAVWTWHGCRDWGVGAGGGGGSGIEGYAQKEAMYHETAGCIYAVYV